MSLRYKGGLISPSVNPLAANVTTSPSVAQYNGVFNLQEQGRAITSGEWCTDPYYKNTTLLLHADGKANGSQNNTFLDSSTNAFTITRNGNTTQGSFTPYGNEWSSYQAPTTGASRPAIYMASQSAFAFGTGDFSIEFFVNVSNSGAWQIFVDFRSTGNTGAYPCIYLNNSTGYLYYYLNGAVAITGTTTFTYDTWHHVTVARSGTSTKMFLDGVQQGSTLSDSNTYGVGTAGDRPCTTNGDSVDLVPNGYISNLRIVKGQAVYTSAFTPSTTPLTTTSQGVTAANVSLLTLQSNRYVDNSTNGFTVRINGAPSVQRFSPFAPQYQYTPAVIGGSGYFDGSGDYLQSVTGSSGSPGSGDFCAEAWIYPQNTTTMAIIGNLVNSGGSDTQWGLYMNKGSNYIQFQGWFTVFATGAAPALNTWNHVAACRSGTTLSLFLNGTRIATTTSANNFSSTNDIRIGAEASGTSPFFGYIADARFVKGSSVYTPSSTTITVPTAPLTAVTNTQLLTNMTNAGIYDNAMMNNLETVGNAQVSTSVVKYGSGSLKFDGTGDYLQAPHTTVAEFGSGNFTVEFWSYINAQSGAYTGVVGQWVAGASNAANSWNVSTNLYNTTNKLGFSYSDGSATTDVAFGSALTTGTWSHYAICRSGNLLYAFKDGVLLNTGGTSITATINNGTSVLRVGSVGTTGGGSDFNGYLDDLRITKGVARYTANFQPPKVAFANQ